MSSASSAMNAESAPGPASHRDREGSASANRSHAAANANANAPANQRSIPAVIAGAAGDGARDANSVASGTLPPLHIGGLAATGVPAANSHRPSAAASRASARSRSHHSHVVFLKALKTGVLFHFLSSSSLSAYCIL